MAIRTIAYLRVSTGGQDLGHQKLAILEYARQHRITVDDVVEVHASTRRVSQRAHVLALIDTLSSGDRLIVSELSRLGRSLGQILQIVDHLVQKGVRLVAIKEAIRLEGKQTLQSKAMLTLFGLFAEIERDLIAERTKEGLIAAKAQGKRLGRPKGAFGKSNCSCVSTSPKRPLHGSSRSRPPRSSTLSTRGSCRRYQTREDSPSCTRRWLVWESMKLYVSS